MANIKIRFSEAEIRAFLEDPLGPVAHLIEELGGRAVLYAKARVKKRLTATPGKHGRGGGAPPLSTAESIYMELIAGRGQEPYANVWTDLIGLFIEKGTQPHIIRSHGPWSLSNYGTGYFGPVVKHPGTRPYPFMIEALWSLQGDL